MKSLSNQWHRPYLNTILGAFLLTMTSFHLSAQVTLNTYKDPNKSSYYESITFEYTDTSAPVASGTTPPKQKKEFNIQENNPYNQLEYTTKGIASNGAKIYSIPQNQRNQTNSQSTSGSNPSSQYEELTASSYSTLKKSGDFVVVGYELGFSSEGESLETGRRSTLIVLDGSGNETFKIDDKEMDFYLPAVSSNGRYLAFATGEYLEHSQMTGLQKIKIYDTRTGNIYFEEQIESTFIAAFKQMISIETVKYGRKRRLILDQNDGAIYEMYYENRLTLKNYNHLIYKGVQLSFSDLTKIK